MRKLLLILLGGILLTVQSRAQSYLSEKVDTSEQIWTGPDMVKVHNPLKSASPTPVKVKWRLVDKYLAPGTSLTGFCDNYNCYPGNDVVLGESYVSNPYKNTPFNYSNTTDPNDPDVHLFEAQFVGFTPAPIGTISWVRMLVKDNADTTVTGNHSIMTFVAMKTTNGVSRVSVSGDDLVIFPNPAREAVNVIFDADAGIRSVAVYNLIGRAVKVYKTTGSSAKIELNDVASGVYFLRLMNAQGQIVTTRKFSHQ